MNNSVDTECRLPLSIEELIVSPSFGSTSEASFRAPTAHEIKSLMLQTTLSSADVAVITGADGDRDGLGVVERWLLAPTDRRYLTMPVAAWRLLAVTTYLIEPDRFVSP